MIAGTNVSAQKVNPASGISKVVAFRIFSGPVLFLSPLEERLPPAARYLLDSIKCTIHAGLPGGEAGR